MKIDNTVITTISSDEEDEYIEFKNEVNDFSNSSNLEIFSSSIENIISKWDLENNEFLKSKINFKNSIDLNLLYFNDFNLKELSISKTLLFSENDFPKKSHHLQRWFGLKKFFIINTLIDNEILTENEARIFLRFFFY
jgi:hypothetical protein